MFRRFLTSKVRSCVSLLFTKRLLATKSIEPDSFKKRLRVSVALAASVGVTALGFEVRKRYADEKSVDEERSRETIGAAKWTLTDHAGKQVSRDDFLGKWALIYFGYCHCPDICPEEIEKLCECITKNDANPVTKLDLVPLFITVDPRRDNVPAVAKYVADFSPRLIGLTGSEEQINIIKKSFHVYGGFGEEDEFGDYIVDHTIIIYFMNPDGQFTDYFSRRRTSDDILRVVARHSEEYHKKKARLYSVSRTVELIGDVCYDSAMRVWNFVLRRDNTETEKGAKSKNAQEQSPPDTKTKETSN